MAFLLFGTFAIIIFLCEFIFPIEVITFSISTKLPSD
jgi:hypothetical protein